jgi:glutamate formiminotransferase
MNLLDTAATPLHVVYERVEQLAQQAGTAIDRSELIGLAPQQALLAAAAHDVGLGGLGEGRTVEGAIRRMAALGGR